MKIDLSSSQTVIVAWLDVCQEDSGISDAELERHGLSRSKATILTPRIRDQSESFAEEFSRDILPALTGAIRFVELAKIEDDFSVLQDTCHPKKLLIETILPHVLNYGMGVDSTEILVRWCEMSEEERGFPLENLIVLTAQTGDEYQSTKELVETYAFPLIRKHGIRFVEIAKGGPSVKDGYVLLQDTRNPETLNIDGHYKLSTHMREAGTTVCFTGPHKCAMKFKGTIIDQWLSENLKGRAFGPYLGYAKGEESRAIKCDGYTCYGMTWRFPLLRWGLGRFECLEHLQETFGVHWLKSCCKACPFQKREEAMSRWLRETDAGVESLLTEHNSVTFNPVMDMFAHGSAMAMIQESENTKALETFFRDIGQMDWGLYRVRRTYERPMGRSGKPYSRVKRNLEKVYVGTMQEASSALRLFADESGEVIETDDRGISRLWFSRRGTETIYPKTNRGKVKQIPVWPSTEGYWVIAPVMAESKVQNKSKFEETWEAINKGSYIAPDISRFTWATQLLMSDGRQLAISEEAAPRKVQLSLF